MNDIQKTRLRQGFTACLPLPPTLEPHLKEALGRVPRHPVGLKPHAPTGSAKTEYFNKLLDLIG